MTGGSSHDDSEDDATTRVREPRWTPRRARPAEPTPITHSYGDALLNGRMTPAQLDAIRAEILGPVPLAPTSSPPPPLDAEVAPPSSTTESRAKQLRERIGARDFAGGLRIAEEMLALRPDDELARRCAEDCREMLVRLYLAEMGSLDDFPVVVVDPLDLRTASLDQWSGYVLSCIDGRTSITELIDICNFPRLDTLRLLYGLTQAALVRVDKQPAPSRR